MGSMSSRTSQVQAGILKALADFDGPAGAARITRRIRAMGMNLQPRTVRFYLLKLDQAGLTRFVSRRQGRELTEQGREELQRSNVLEKVGFVADKVDALGYRMSFNHESYEGTIVANIALVSAAERKRVMSEMRAVFAQNLGMGTRLAIAEEGEELGDVTVPAGSIAVGTVCSVTLNGIMLHEGIPVTSRFGGLIEMRDGTPQRFVELIEYHGTTIDPLEVFINAGMTRVRECAETGKGMIGASFREIPSVAVDDVARIRKEMESYGLGGILAVGDPGQPLLDIPVAERRTGIIVVGGLNPVAAVHEAGITVSMTSLSGLADIDDFSSYEKIS